MKVFFLPQLFWFTQNLDCFTKKVRSDRFIIAYEFVHYVSQKRFAIPSRHDVTDLRLAYYFCHCEVRSKLNSQTQGLLSVHNKA